MPHRGTVLVLLQAVGFPLNGAGRDADEVVDLCQEAEWTIRLEDLNSRIHELQSVNSKKDD